MSVEDREETAPSTSDDFSNTIESMSLPMTSPLADVELDHLLNFIGYGTLDADVWFLGMEGAGGGEDNLRTRLKFRPVEDNAEAHKMLGV